MITTMKVSQFGHLELDFGGLLAVIECGSDIPVALAPIEACTAEDRAAIEAKAAEVWTPERLAFWAARKAPPAPTVADFTRAIQMHLDAAAVAKGYDNIFTMVTYAGESAVPQFQNEARAYRAWRSLLWAAAAEILADVQAQIRPVPTIAELIADLPAVPE